MMYRRQPCERGRLDAQRVQGLEVRARVLAALRSFFAEREFLEVETPLLVPAPGLEIHLQAVPAGRDRWLITSPEYQMKRLLVAGLERIYTVCKCFRAEEEGHQHASEFTMLEWYRAHAGLDDIRRDTEELVAAAVRAVRGEARIVRTGPGGPRVIDLEPPWPVMSVAEAMERWAGVAVYGDEDAATLSQRVRAAGIDLGSACRWDDVFFTAFVERVEPALAALDRPLFLCDWPAPLAALARRIPGRPQLAERFEAYVGGLELANAFGELCDPREQRQRFAEDLRERGERGKPQYPVDEKFLAALEEGMPASSGIALGVDRLSMLAAGAGHIREVLTFTGDEL